MAGIATDVRFAVGELGIDVVHHLEHHARRHLHLLLVARPVSGDVAIIAHYAQPGNGKTHVGHVGFRRKNLKVLWWSCGTTSTATSGRGGVLCGQYKSANRKKEK